LTKGIIPIGLGRLALVAHPKHAAASPGPQPTSYKGFDITARTFQIRGSGRWTLDLLIGRRGAVRAFTGPATYPSEQAAIAGCCGFARRIIDGKVRGYSVEDLD
jgi:hypothetical protein